LVISPLAIRLNNVFWYKAYNWKATGRIQSRKKRERYFKDGKYNYYFSGSDIVEQTVEIRNGKRHGECLNYYDNGNINSTITYNNGIQNGFTRSYDPNGLLIRQSKFKNGSYHDKSIEYYENGVQRMTEDHHQNGYVFFDCNQKKRCEIFVSSHFISIDEYRTNRSVNIWYKWLWKVKERAKYEPFGIWQSYSPLGHLEYELDFDNLHDTENDDILVSKRTYGVKGELQSSKFVKIKELKIESFDKAFFTKE
jgi:antitoxin component YwqK of YwqJK toxin-antitoxin module